MNKRAVTYGGALLLVQLLSGCTSESATPAERDATPTPAAAPEQAIGDEALVIAFGDSLFAGYQLAQREGLAPSLERALERNGVAVEVVNAGVSGDTSATGRQRLAFTLDGQRKPALVIVGLGGNDMLRGVAPSETRANLDLILAELKGRQIPAVLSGMVAAPNLGPNYAREFNAIYPDLSKKYEVPLYPFTLAGVIGQPGLMLGDAIHPSAKGVAVIADRMAPMVANTIGKKGG